MDAPSVPAPAAEVDARDPHGVPPLMRAVDRQQLQSVLELLYAGANPNVRADDGASPVSLAVENYRARVGLPVTRLFGKQHGHGLPRAITQALADGLGFRVVAGAQRCAHAVH